MLTYGAFGKVVGEMTDWMQKHGVNSLRELKGAAHHAPRHVSAPA